MQTIGKYTHNDHNDIQSSVLHCDIDYRAMEHAGNRWLKITEIILILCIIEDSAFPTFFQVCGIATTAITVAVIIELRKTCTARISWPDWPKIAVTQR